MNSRPVKRISDVIRLRSVQFAEAQALPSPYQTQILYSNQ